MIVGWTGHRPELFLHPAYAHAELDRFADAFRTAQVFVSGGQRGVDTWAAQAGFRLGVAVHLILPQPPGEFARDWSSDDRLMLEWLLTIAEVRIAKGFSERNRLVATSVDVLVAVWTGTAGGGTAETLEFARDAGVAVREVRLDRSAAAASARGRGI